MAARSAEREIRALGVKRLTLFGSVLRDEARPDSDVDILAEFFPGSESFDHLLRLYDLLEECLGHRVEVVTTESLSPFIGPRILAEAEDVEWRAMAGMRDRLIHDYLGADYEIVWDVVQNHLPQLRK